MKSIITILASVSCGLAAAASIFCAIVGAFALAVADLHIALWGWIGMLWFALCSVCLLDRLFKRSL